MLSGTALPSARVPAFQGRGWLASVDMRPASARVLCPCAVQPLLQEVAGKQPLIVFLSVERAQPMSILCPKPSLFSRLKQRCANRSDRLTRPEELAGPGHAARRWGVLCGRKEKAVASGFRETPVSPAALYRFCLSALVRNVPEPTDSDLRDSEKSRALR